jgi:hypothetical protein
MVHDESTMSKVRELHNKAMELAQKAIVLRHEGSLDEAEECSRKALEYETEAASLIELNESSEPTRSILYRSAASLALQAKEFTTAQRLLANGLLGYPTPDIEQELWNLIEQLNFERHLHDEDLVLSDAEIQFSVLGDAVMYGVVLFDEFVKRLSTFRTVLERTTLRLFKTPYKRSSKIPKSIMPFETVLTTAEAGSFAIILKLATPTEKYTQRTLPGLAPKPSEVFEEVVSGIELINNLDDEGLKNRITDESYYINFRSLIRDMAPDGEKIKQVGLITARKSVGLTKPKKEIPAVPQMEKIEEVKKVTITGILDYARSRRDDVIGLTDEKEKHHLIKIDKGMDDLVKSYFMDNVKVTGTFSHPYIIPTEIEPVDE